MVSLSLGQLGPAQLALAQSKQALSSNPDKPARPQIQVRGIAGEELKGTFQEISPAEFTLAQAGGSKTIPLEELAAIQFEIEIQSQTDGLKLTLSDGGQITASQVTSDGQNLLVQIPSKLLSLSSAAVANIQIGDFSPEQQKYWDENLESPLEADQLLVRQSSGALTKIDGIVDKITEEAVEFEFSGQTIPVPYARLAGIRFYRNDVQPTQPIAGSLVDRSGNSYRFAKIQSEGNTLQLDLACGPELEIPLSEVYSVNFSLGNLQRLAELEPLRTSSEPVFQFPVQGVEPGQTFGIRHLTPIRLPGKVRGPGLEFLGDGAAVYEVPSGFTQFSGSVQLAPKGSKFTRCEVTILLEGEVLWKTKLQQPRRPVSFQVEVEEDQRLELKCESSTSLPTGNIVQWLDPVLTK